MVENLDLAYFNNMFDGVKEDFMSVLEVSKDKVQKVILKRIHEGTDVSSSVLDEVKEGIGAFADHSAHEAISMGDSVQNFAKDKVSEVSEGTKSIFFEGINYIKEVVNEHRIPNGDL